MNNYYLLKKQFKKLTATLVAVSLFAFSGEFSVMAATNDPYLNAQWGINNTGEYQYNFFNLGQSNHEHSKEDVDINLFEGWEALPASAMSNEVIVAVIDTGVYTEHEDLKNHIWINQGEIPDNGIDDDGNGYIDDVYGWDFYNNDNTVYHDEVYVDSIGTIGEDDHGTHVAGIIAAEANNGVGITGIASIANVKVMVLKTNGGKNSEGSAESACKAIEYAEKMGAKIVNMSWGSYGGNEDLRRAMAESKMLFVCAAGNNGINNDNYPMYPASYDLDNIISVTYITPFGKLATTGDRYFSAGVGSNYGKKSVDLAAPGYDIISTIKLGNGYGYKTGSSMAAPYVTGVAALVYAAKPDAYAVQVKNLIMDTAKTLPDLEGKTVVPGIPDLKAIAQNLYTLKKDIVKPHITTKQSLVGTKVNVTVNTDDAGGSGVYLVKYLEGVRGVSDFQNGAGTVIHDGNVLLDPGDYTFYAMDRSGNDMISAVYIGNDNEPPRLEAKVKARGNYDSYGITLHMSDDESEVKILKYIVGETTEEEVKTSGKEITITGSTMNLATDIENTKISFYAEDGFGNGAFLEVKLERISAYSVITSATYKEVRYGETYKLAAMMLPLNTTDTISYASSNKMIATVSEDGTVTAVYPGECVITVKTQSGISIPVKIKVIY